jgi:tRNA nucleotidyltransferase (CCA-adding enzyme)
MNNWEKLKKEIIDDLRPTEEEETQLHRFSEKIIIKLNNVLANSGLRAVAELHGSVAHETWIRGQHELDIFIVIENYDARKQLKQVLEIVRKGTDWCFTEAYAEHPYLKTEINGYSIDIVPCFKTNGEIRSSTDRTPLHTEWLKPRLVDLGDEVRLLKQFVTVLGLYGAEIKVGGFSGYLCELLVIKYDSFWNLVNAASKWGRKEEIVLKGKPSRRFEDPLTVIDPVDFNRNVASALREESYWKFISASRSFIKEPRRSFFMVKESKEDPVKVLEMLENRATDIMFIVVEESKAEVPDTLWGQLYKSRHAIEQQLKTNGFDVLRSTTWSNEVTRHVFVYELATAAISKAVKHYGPPTHLESNVEEFIDTYRDNGRIISGPDIEENKWYVILKRENCDAKVLVEKILSDGGRSIGVSRKTALRILHDHRVLLNQDIEDYLVDGFDGFLLDWLNGRPSWIE